LRGNQTYDSNITLLYLSKGQLNQKGLSNKWLIDDSNYNFFWDKVFWKKTISQLLESHAQKIIININIDHKLILKDYDPIFSNKKVYWSSFSNKPILNKEKLKINIYTNDILPDSDGLVRYYKNNNKEKINLLEKLFPSDYLFKNHAINYRGYSGLYKNKVISAQQKKIEQLTSNKIVIIGSNSLSNDYFKTPLGKMNSSEVLANVIDNYKNKQWIKNFNFNWGCLYLLVILIITILIIFSFPQPIALTYLIWIIFGITALSIALFDTLNFWIPILAPLLQIVATYVLFLSYQLNVKDYKNWKLQEEQRLQSKSQQLKNNFVSLISHDLKTPIAKIQGICDRIISLNPESKFLNDIQLVRTETEELNRYIQSILQVTKVESKDFKLQKKPIDINKIIEKVLSHLKFLIIEHENKVKLNLEPIFLIEVDPVLIYEVFLNIIENSLKYAPKSIISINTYETDQFVHIEFKDSGPGINEEDLKFIFDKFYRAKSSKQKAKGTGLGLYLVKYFIQLHNGNISIDSQINHGTEIHIKLPIDN